ncbi:MAG TPA: TlyA family RNA methyltransferase, partial [Candidatus Acidoferrum sp.]|nr:TlyA family RNA methyltransferase [Candidatus Acidoferrum sp.]
MILSGEVFLEGKRAEKSGMQVDCDVKIEIAARQQKYVSRGGFKLEGALRDFSIDPTGFVCVDIGASHGGFTDCLLQHGAGRVCAVDVNVEQMDWKLQHDPRVVRIKRNARELRTSDVPGLVDLVVIDVSFISVCKVIAPALAAAKPGASFLILIKPQFELPRKAIARGGIVSDKELH